MVSLRNGCLPNVGVALNLLIPNLSEVDGLECWEVVEVRPCLASSSSINGVQCFIQFVLLCRFALSPVFAMDSICIELDNVGREVFPKATGILVFNSNTWIPEKNIMYLGMTAVANHLSSQPSSTWRKYVLIVKLS